MATYEKSSSKDIKRLIASLLLLFIAGGSMIYLVGRFGANPMAMKDSVTWDQILHPGKRVAIHSPEPIVHTKGQVAGAQDENTNLYAIQTINVKSLDKGPNTMTIARIGETQLLQYNYTVIAPPTVATISNIDTSDIQSYPWRPLFSVTGNASNAQVFNYYLSPDTTNAVVIMQSSQGSTNTYDVYVYNELSQQNYVRKINSFTENPSKASVPVATGVSQDGRYVTLNLYRCADCLTDTPETLVVDTKLGYYKNIGQTSLVEWIGGGKFQYKEFKEAECPDTTEASRCSIDPQFLPFIAGDVMVK